jgi:hypothetical protein
MAKSVGLVPVRLAEIPVRVALPVLESVTGRAVAVEESASFHVELLSDALSAEGGGETKGQRLAEALPKGTAAKTRNGPLKHGIDMGRGWG